MPRLLPVLLVAACADLREHALTMDVTFPDGRVAAVEIEAPSVLEAGLQAATASWPAEEGADPRLVLAFSAYRLGTVGARSTILTLDGVEHDSGGPAEVEVDVDRLRWLGSGRFPFQHEGRVTGTFSDGLQRLDVDGAFTITERACGEQGGPVPSPACGAALPGNVGDAASWQVVAWVQDDCPAEIRDHYVDGDVITTDGRTLRLGEARPLRCVGTDPGRARVVQCGADDVVRVDGCRWAVAAMAHPDGQLRVSAAVVDEACEPAWCAVEASAFAPVEPADES